MNSFQLVLIRYHAQTGLICFSDYNELSASHWSSRALASIIVLVEAILKHVWVGIWFQLDIGCSRLMKPSI